MLAYYVPYAKGFAFEVEHAPKVVFVANLGASIGAFLLPLIDRARRLSVLIAFLGGTLTALAVPAPHSMEVLVALFLNMVASEWA
jgi:hypothetical protein